MDPPRTVIVDGTGQLVWQASGSAPARCVWRSLRAWSRCSSAGTTFHVIGSTPASIASCPSGLRMTNVAGPARANLAIGLGGVGVRLTDLISLYAMIASGGQAAAIHH